MSLGIDRTSTYQNCVLPTPGLPTNSVIDPIQIPPPIASSISLHNVMIEPASFSSVQTS